MMKKALPLLLILPLGACCCNYGIVSLRGYTPGGAPPRVVYVQKTPQAEPPRTQQVPDFIKRAVAPEPAPEPKPVPAPKPAKKPEYDPLNGS